MRIEFLGTGGYHPNERRHTACVMLPEEGIVFDAGTSAFRIASRLKTEALDIFLSHAHLDHIAGLTYFLVPVMSGAVQALTVHATPGVLEAVRTHLFSEALFPVNPPFAMRELASTGACPAGKHLTMHWTPLSSHPGGSMAYRLDRQDGQGVVRDSSGGGVRAIARLTEEVPLTSRNKPPGADSVAYVTDTFVDGTYTEFIRGVDVLIHECYFGDDRAEFAEKTGHSFASQVAHLAREAAVGRLIAIHIDPQNETDDPIGLAAMRKIFPNTQLAEDGMTIEI